MPRTDKSGKVGRKWKKGFRGIPEAIIQKISKLNGKSIRIRVGKKISIGDIDSGLYAHLGITPSKVAVGQTWDILPEASVGITSKRNSEGWEVVRTDLPKFTKYFYQDIPIYGDGARNGWTIAAIPREVYEREYNPAFLHKITIEISEKLPGDFFGIKFAIDAVFLNDSSLNNEDLLFSINLLQENVGCVDISDSEDDSYIFNKNLDWSVFPPGNIEDVVNSLATSVGENQLEKNKLIRDRLELFNDFEPIEYLRGLGGSDHYIGAKFAEDLVVFENIRYGNALYVLYSDWEEQSKKPRSELLKLPTSKFDRIVHILGWETKFMVLMQRELQSRGRRVRIGRRKRYNQPKRI